MYPVEKHGLQQSEFYKNNLICLINYGVDLIRVKFTSRRQCKIHSLFNSFLSPNLLKLFIFCGGEVVSKF